MRTDDRALAQDSRHFEVQPNLREIVMGLHWDPPQDGTRSEPEDLDAMCVLFDEQHRVLDVIHPGRTRNDNGSVIHTGDSRTGASEWDDERIFVFLEALPDAVAAVSFVVISATGRAFGAVRGASCHVSDHATEHEWVRINLTTLETHTAYDVATVRRGPAGWNMTAHAHALHDGLLADLLSLVKRGKAATSGPREPKSGTARRMKG